MSPTDVLLEGIIARGRVLDDAAKIEAIMTGNPLYQRHRMKKSWVANQRRLESRLNTNDATYKPFTSRNKRMAGLTSVYAGDTNPHDYKAVSFLDMERLILAFRARKLGRKLDLTKVARMSYKDVTNYQF